MDRNPYTATGTSENIHAVNSCPMLNYQPVSVIEQAP